jgi:tetratricopeptide (TPR) repeat protein
METTSARTKEAIAQIKRSATDGKLVAVIGTGISLALTNGANLALSWKGLVDNGFEYGAMKGKISGAQKLSWQPQLVSEDIDDLLGAAEFMGRKLDAPNGDLYGRWLESVFKEVNPENNEMARAVRALQTAGVPICTLNYDPLLERVTGLPGITFAEIAKVTSWMRRESQGILHLHGSWDSPATCILGIRDYETTISDEVRDLIQRNLSSFSRLLFIGCGDTFVDPNFSALIKWLRERMKTAAPQHYALVSDAEEIRRHADPSWHGFVDPVSYGPTHSDLAAFLLNHFPSEKRLEKYLISIPPATDLDLSIRCIDDHEPKPQIFGRDDEIETIVNALLDDKTILVAGGPGMGKTAVATAALYDPRVVANFGRRRVFASLETATEPRAILAKLVEALGLPPTGDEVSLLHIIEATAAEAPFAAILDNSETVFDANRGAAERLLSLVSQIRGLSLVVTIRGVAPPISGAVQISDLAKLDLSAAREAFLAIAGDSFGGDSNLPHLLEALDGHALSIRLVAAQAIGTPSLKGLRESWDEVHAEILRISGEEEGRLTSVRASLSLSLNSRRMKATPLARRLMALLAFLPGGLAEHDVTRHLGELGAITKIRANEAISCLHQLRLVEKRPDHRLRMLTPLRECAKSDVNPLEGDLDRLTQRYLKLATRANTIGTNDWAKYRETIEGEADNLDAICENTAAANIAYKGLQKAIEGLLRFHLVSGRASAGSIDAALVKLLDRPPSNFLASCIQGKGGIARTNSNYEMGRLRYKEALLLYRNLRNPLGEANCIFSLADIAMLLSDHKTACNRAEEALALYRKLTEPIGEANCIYILGAIALARRDHDSANTYFREALALCQGPRNIMGKANIVKGFADLALSQSDCKLARTLVVEALAFYQDIGGALGESNCIRILGDIANAESDFFAAAEYYDQARILYRRVGEVGGEALSMVKLGTVQRRASKDEQGLLNIEAGFGLYFKSSDSNDLSLPGWQAMHLALTCGNKSEANKHCELARLSWMGIERLDLVYEWVDSESS